MKKQEKRYNHYIFAYLYLQGNSGTKKLDNKYNNFERGQKDVFVVDLPDLGKQVHFLSPFSKEKI